MEFIDCKSIAQKWKDEIKEKNIDAGLCVIQVGDDSASNSYIKGKKKDCEEIGFRFKHVHIQETNECEIRRKVKWALIEQSVSNDVDGCILQLPLPNGVTLDFKIENCLSDTMDVDGFNPDSKFKPCTPEAVMELLKEIGVDVMGKHCVIAGYSNIVGKPLSHMMSEAGATVTVCRSRTPEKLLYKLASEADVFVSAVGRSKFITSDIFKDGAIVIDVGINRTKDGLRGDIEIVPNTRDIRITPVPGGVGLLTRAMLMRHIFEAYIMNNHNSRRE